MEITTLIGYVAVVLALMFGIAFGEDGMNFAMLLNFLNGAGIFIVIGGTFTVSGPVSHAGLMALEGAEAAIKYVNEELGGINGREVVLKYYDDEFDESKIPMLYERLITQDKVDLLVSPYTSPFLAAAPVVAKQDRKSVV